jgi:hypothetical protein
MLSSIIKKYKKMIISKDIIFNNPPSLIRESFFRIYLFLGKYDNRQSYKNSVYDQYGLIDTLGNRQEIGQLTGSYSDELTSSCWINLLFNYCIESSNCCGSYSIRIFKKPIYDYD